MSSLYIGLLIFCLFEVIVIGIGHETSPLEILTEAAIEVYWVG
jgi:hypothetical protein